MTVKSELKLHRKYFLIVAFVLFSITGFSFSNYNLIQSSGPNDFALKNNSTVNYKTNSSSNVEYKYDGIIEVSDDDKEIKSISPDGYLKFSIKTFGNKRIIKIISNSEGKLQYEYFENKQELPFIPDGKQLLSEVLIDIIRLSGIDAENRTKRIYSKSGLDGFILEITEIPSNNIRSLYISSFLSIPNLSEAELISIAENIPVRISSETECAILYRNQSSQFLKIPGATAAFLRSVKKMYSNTERGSVLRSINSTVKVNNESVSIPYFNVVNTMESNTEKGSVLRDLIKKQELSDDSYIHFLMTTKKLTSSTELGSVIRSIKKINLNNSDVSLAYFAAINSISSSTEKGSVLRYTYKTHQLGHSSMNSFLLCTKRISSNTELGLVLRSLDNIELLDDYNIMQSYFAAVNSLASNTEKGWVLRELIKSTKLNTPAFKEFYYSTKRLSSNTELGFVMRESIPHLTDDHSVIDAFFLATNSIASNTEHGRVLRELIRRGDIDDYTISEILHSTKRISSNTEMASVLIELAKLIPKNNAKLVNEFKSTAGSLSSKTEFQRVMESIE